MVAPEGFRKTNHFAVAGFLLPFVAAGMTGVLILLIRDDFRSVWFLLPYLSLIPLILVAALVFSLKSIPLIAERDDKDYAYSGLTLSILFLSIYCLSLAYFFFYMPD